MACHHAEGKRNCLLAKIVAQGEKLSKTIHPEMPILLSPEAWRGLRHMAHQVVQATCDMQAPVEELRSALKNTLSRCYDDESLVRKKIKSRSNSAYSVLSKASSELCTLLLSACRRTATLRDLVDISQKLQRVEETFAMLSVEISTAVEVQLQDLRERFASALAEVRRSEQVAMIYVQDLRNWWGSDHAIWPELVVGTSDSGQERDRKTFSRNQHSGEHKVHKCSCTKTGRPRICTEFDRLAASPPGSDLEAEALHTISLVNIQSVASSRVLEWEAKWKKIVVCRLCCEPTPADFCGIPSDVRSGVYATHGKINARGEPFCLAHLKGDTKTMGSDGELQSTSSDSCDHDKSICQLCLRTYVLTGISSNGVTESGIRCLEPTCHIPMSDASIQKLLCKQHTSQYLRFKRHAMISADKARRWCPQPGCDGVINLDESTSCQLCATLVCVDCGAVGHIGKSCDEAADVGLMSLAKQFGWKKCPFCNKMVERIEGCDSMECKHLGCRQTFCFACAKHPCACVRQYGDDIW
jgi:hypothetical protein